MRWKRIPSKAGAFQSLIKSSNQIDQECLRLLGKPNFYRLAVFPKKKRKDDHASFLPKLIHPIFGYY